MEGETDGESKCTFQWKIENISHFWWLQTGQAIVSPVFISNALQDTEWNLSLIDFGPYESVIGLYLHRQRTCSGPDVIEVYYQFAFLDEYGSILIEGPSFKEKFSNDDSSGWANLQGKRIFDYQRKIFLNEDALNVRCTIWIKDKKPVKTNYLSAATVFKLKRRTFLWKIDEVSTLKSSMRNKFRDYLIGCYLILSRGLDRLDIDITSFHNSIKYISCNTSIIDSEGRKENCDINKYFGEDLKKAPISIMLLFPKMLMENKSQYFPNDILTLDFEFALLTVKDLCYRKNSIVLENEVVEIKKYQYLIDDLKSLYNDGTFGDMELLTSTKTFPANKFILSARSPVFRNMFIYDMKEKNSGQVNITDFDDDTVHRMLLYMYTDSLEGLEWESAIELYKIADKYQILSLKSRCSSFLKQELCSTNVYDALVLAYLHSDDDLKDAAQDYILGEHKQIFSSPEWESFMSAHLILAADIMHRKLTQGT